MSRAVWRLMLSCTLVSMLLSGTSCPPADGNGDNVTTVEMSNIAFVPKDITITVGQTVRWINQDVVPHTTTSGNPGDADAGSLWDSGFLTPGQTFEHTFNDTGTFTYYCRVHPTIMRDATVTVQAVPGLLGEP